jgi:hypothetical protein
MKQVVGFWMITLMLLAVSCTGSLSDEQRKKIKENMKQGEIKKVTEAEIMEAAFAQGRKVAAQVDRLDKLLMNEKILDSLSSAMHVEIISLQDNNPALRSVEKQLLEAYQSGGTQDNVQRVGPDSLIYTKPIVREHPDGRVEFLKAVGIRMTRKQLVLSINH